MPGFLTDLVTKKLREGYSREVVLEEALSAPKRFEPDGFFVIAEYKRRSPSLGAINEEARTAEVVRSYVSGGAAALSVLTEREHFGGSLTDLREVASISPLPVLRKDFIIFEEELEESRKYGASLVLLIVRALQVARVELRAMYERACSIGLLPLVEVFGQEDLEVLSDFSPRLVGVNRRDLESLQVAPDLREDLLQKVRELCPDALVVLESGIESEEEVRKAAQTGYDGVLVGSSLMKAARRREFLESLVEAGRSAKGARQDLRNH